MMLMQSKFETYLLDEEHEDVSEVIKELADADLERATYPEGFFTEL